jgi:hypothetical protein
VPVTAKRPTVTSFTPKPFTCSPPHVGVATRLLLTAGPPPIVTRHRGLSSALAGNVRRGMQA